MLLCDVHLLPGISGVEATERVVRGNYATRVIVVAASQALFIAASVALLVKMKNALAEAFSAIL